MAAIRKVSESSRPMRVDLFYYKGGGTGTTEGTTDLLAGDAVRWDVSETVDIRNQTIGRGKIVEVYPGSGTTPTCVGVSQFAVDISVQKSSWIPVVTRGVFAAQADTDVTQGTAAIAGGANDGELEDMADGEEELAIGSFLEDDGATTAGRADVWLWGKFVCDSPA